MKRFVAVLMMLCFLSAVASAEYDLSDMSLEDLEALRAEVSTRIVEILSNTPQETPDDAIGTIAEIFPDEPFAMCVRDELGKLSINQPVTQAELDTVTRLTAGSKSSFGEITSIVGIDHLRNLERIVFGSGAAKGMTELPDEFYQLIKLKYIFLYGSNITYISPEIGNLVNLKTLKLPRTAITTLPNELINCTLLEELDISYTNITEVPAVLFSMPNVKVSMEGTNVK